MFGTKQLQYTNKLYNEVTPCIVRPSSCLLVEALLTFRCDCVGFRAVCILIGRGQHVLVGPWVLLTGHGSSRRRQREDVNAFVLHGDVLLVLNGSFVVSVPPLLALVRCRRSPPLRVRAVSISFLC